MSLVLESMSLSQTDKMWSALHPAEKTSPDPLLAVQETQRAQSGATAVTIHPEGGKSSQAGPTGLLSRLKAWACRWAVLSVALNLILIISFIFFLILVLTALPAKKCEPCPVTTCPNGWVGYLGKCYYFSKAETNWASSLSNCSALNASLAAIDTPEEMDFMKRYKESFDYWIGLRRDLSEPWKWTNGTEFNNWFPVAGGEKCAFMNQNDIASSSCSREGRWICSKHVEKTDSKETRLSPG